MMTQEAERLPEPFRQYLTVLAELHLDRKLRGKLDPSDIVQQSFLRPYSALAEGAVRARSPGRLAAQNPGEHAGRRRQALRPRQACRQPGAVLEADLDRSASGFAAWLAADQTSPSGRAERNEELLRLVEMLCRISPTRCGRSSSSNTARVGLSSRSPNESTARSRQWPPCSVAASKT